MSKYKVTLTNEMSHQIYEMVINTVEEMMDIKFLQERYPTEANRVTKEDHIKTIAESIIRNNTTKKAQERTSIKNLDEKFFEAPVEEPLKTSGELPIEDISALTFLKQNRQLLEKSIGYVINASNLFDVPGEKNPTIKELISQQTWADFDWAETLSSEEDIQQTVADKIRQNSTFKNFNKFLLEQTRLESVRHNYFVEKSGKSKSRDVTPSGSPTPNRSIPSSRSSSSSPEPSRSGRSKIKPIEEPHGSRKERSQSNNSSESPTRIRLSPRENQGGDSPRKSPSSHNYEKKNRIQISLTVSPTDIAPENESSWSKKVTEEKALKNKGSREDLLSTRKNERSANSAPKSKEEQGRGGL